MIRDIKSDEMKKSPDPAAFLIDGDDFFSPKEDQPAHIIFNNYQNISEFDPLSDSFTDNQNNMTISSTENQTPTAFSEELNDDNETTFSENIKSKASNRVFKVIHRHRYSEADLPPNFNSADLKLFDPISPKRGKIENNFNKEEIEEIKECLENNLFAESSTERIEFSNIELFNDKIFDSAENGNEEPINSSDEEDKQLSVGRFQITKFKVDQPNPKRRKTLFKISRFKLGESSTLNQLPSITDDSDEEVPLKATSTVNRVSSFDENNQNNPIAVNFLSNSISKLNNGTSKFKIHITHHSDEKLS